MFVSISAVYWAAWGKLSIINNLPLVSDEKQYQRTLILFFFSSSYLVNNLEATLGWISKSQVCKLLHLLCLFDCSPLLEATNQPDRVREASFMNETATCSQGTGDWYFINPAFFAPVLSVYKLTQQKQSTLTRFFAWAPAFWDFVCVHLWSIGRGNFPIFCVHPIVNWSEMKPKQTLCSVTVLNPLPARENIKRRLIKWNTQATPLSHDTGPPSPIDK